MKKNGELSLEQLRQKLHISKRKAAWMLQHGIIKCEISEKKTKQYTVRMDDLFEYLDKVEQADPSVKIPVGRFSAKKPKVESVGETSIHPMLYNRPPEDFRLWLEDEWYAEPDLLYSNDVSRITGYAKTSVNRWLEKKILRTVKAQSGVFTTKAWLIDFYYEHAYSIVMKSDAHIEIMKRFYNTETE